MRKNKKKYQYQGGGNLQVDQNQPPKEDMDLLQQFLGMKIQERAINEEEAKQVIDKYMQSNEQERMDFITMVQEQMPNLQPKAPGLDYNNFNQPQEQVV